MKNKKWMHSTIALLGLFGMLAFANDDAEGLDSKLKKLDTREISSNAWASSQLDKFYASKACANGENFVKEFNRLRSEFEDRLDLLDEQMVETLVEQEQNSDQDFLFFDVSRDYWPMLLPSSFPGRRAYSSCGLDLMELEKSLADKKLTRHKRMKKLDAWETCLNSNYREKIPSATQKLIDCYKVLIK